MTHIQHNLAKRRIDRTTATRRLTKRYAEQCELRPTMRNEIPLWRYVEENIAHVMSGSAPLERYDH